MLGRWGSNAGRGVPAVWTRAAQIADRRLAAVAAPGRLALSIRYVQLLQFLGLTVSCLRMGPMASGWEAMARARPMADLTLIWPSPCTCVLRAQAS